MGQGTSRAPPNGQHVISSDQPVRFSQQLVDALQNSPETDGTRAKDLELHIQSRVKAELQRLESEASSHLKSLSSDLSSSAEQSSTLPSPPELGRQKVAKEVESLRKKLERRKMREEVVGDKAVEKAKNEVVKCLRDKGAQGEKRPLDCWREVEEFKRGVARLESQFLGRALQ